MLQDDSIQVLTGFAGNKSFDRPLPGIVRQQADQRVVQNELG